MSMVLFCPEQGRKTMPFSVQVEGRWRVTVVFKDAAFDQQVLISGSSGADGAYAGIPGTSFEVTGAGQLPWTLRIQHNPGSGWADSDLRSTPRVTTGSQITFNIESEDRPGQPDPDFNDLIVRLDKAGAIEIPFRPYAVRPGTMQMMPDGIFEAALGTYYMAVRVQNIWTQSLPAGAQIGISAAGRTLLAAGGIQVVDLWTSDEQEALGSRWSGPG